MLGFIQLRKQESIVLQLSVGGSSLDFANQAIETSDKKIIAVGNTESNNGDILQNRGIKDFLIIKIK